MAVKCIVANQLISAVARTEAMDLRLTKKTESCFCRNTKRACCPLLRWFAFLSAHLFDASAGCRLLLHQNIVAQQRMLNRWKLLQSPSSSESCWKKVIQFFFSFISLRSAESVSKRKNSSIAYILLSLAALKEEWWSPLEFFQTPKSKWWCVCPARCFGRFLHFSCTSSLIPFILKRNDPAWRPDFPQLLSRLPVLPLWLLRSPPPRGRAFLHV